MTISYARSAISLLGTLLTSFFILKKAANIDPSVFKKAVSILWCFSWAMLGATKMPWVPYLMFRPVFCSATIVFIGVMSRMKLDTVVSSVLLSYGISNVLFYAAVVPLTLLFGLFLGVGFAADGMVDFNDPIYLLFYALVAALQFLMAFLFFKIRRFKRGFPFLSGKYAVVVALIIAGVVLAVVSLVISQRENLGSLSMILALVVGVITIGAGVFIWIRRAIKSSYKKWVKTHNDELYRQELAEKDREIQYYKDMNETVRAANHGIRHRQAAMERRVSDLLEKAKTLNISAKFSEELSMALEDIRKLSREYEEKIDSVKVKKSLPSTNIQAIDDLFGLFSGRFANNRIDFMLKVNGSIVHMTDSVIERGKLETLIGDHLQDALIAVNASNSSVRSVLAVIGEAGGHYEFSVHDSGIPFEIDTLARLGTEHVTTHAVEGGSGIGFMTTFETMRKCGASLIIKENMPGGIFSKSVTIRFDGKNQYIIETFRSDSFPNSDRYAVINPKQHFNTVLKSE